MRLTFAIIVMGVVGTASPVGAQAPQLPDALSPYFAPPDCSQSVCASLPVVTAEDPSCDYILCQKPGTCAELCPIATPPKPPCGSNFVIVNDPSKYSPADMPVLLRRGELTLPGGDELTVWLPDTSPWQLPKNPSGGDPTCD